VPSAAVIRRRKASFPRSPWRSRNDPAALARPSFRLIYPVVAFTRHRFIGVIYFLDYASYVVEVNGFLNYLADLCNLFSLSSFRMKIFIGHSALPGGVANVIFMTDQADALVIAGQEGTTRICGG
jgi:hypothetical protein